MDTPDMLHKTYSDGKKWIDENSKGFKKNIFEFQNNHPKRKGVSITNSCPKNSTKAKTEEERENKR